MRMRSIADFGCTKRARKGQGFLGAETRAGSSFRSSWFLQTYRLEKTDETGGVDTQSIEHILHGSVDRRSLPLKRVRNELGVEVTQSAEERTRPHYGDRIGLQSRSGEILHVRVLELVPFVGLLHFPSPFPGIRDQVRVPFQRGLLRLQTPGLIGATVPTHLAHAYGLPMKPPRS